MDKRPGLSETMEYEDWTVMRLVGEVLTCLRFLCWSALRLGSHKVVYK